MSDLVGVTDAFVHLPTKRDALLFDRVGALFLAPRIDTLERSVAADLEWLQHEGVLFELRLEGLDIDDTDPEVRRAGDLATLFSIAHEIVLKIRAAPHDAWHIASHRSLREHLATVQHPGPSNDRDELERKLYQVLHKFIDAQPRVTAAAAHAEGQRLGLLAASHMSRVIAQHYRSAQGINAAPLLTNEALNLLDKELPRESVVVLVTLNAFPEPTVDVPWSEILAFKRDEDVRTALRRLRRWIVTIAAEPHTTRETEQELEFLIDQYREYVKLHRMKMQPGIIETVITVGLGVAENLMKFRFSDAAQQLFGIRARKIALLEAEQKAPGREVAYIVQADTAFGGGA